MSDQESYRYRDQPKRRSVLDQGRVSSWNAGPTRTKKLLILDHLGPEIKRFLDRIGPGPKFYRDLERLNQLGTERTYLKARIGPDSSHQSRPRENWKSGIQLDQFKKLFLGRRKKSVNLGPIRIHPWTRWIPVPNKDPKHVLTRWNIII